MRKIICVAAISAVMLFPACFAPVNITFDNARMLKKNEIKLQGGYSSYYGPRFDISSSDFLTSFVHYTGNYGFSAGYGLSDKINLGVRYEYMDIKEQEVEIFNKVLEVNHTALHYVEVGSKIRLMEDNLALYVPLGVYFWIGKPFSMLDPRLYYTNRTSDKFEFTVAAKGHIVFADGVGFAPGFSLGMGISNNLDRWAFRPELGYDGFMSFGFGLELRLPGNTKK